MCHTDGSILVFHVHVLHPRGADFVGGGAHPIHQSCNEGIHLKPSNTGQYKLPQELLWSSEV